MRVKIACFVLLEVPQQISAIPWFDLIITEYFIVQRALLLHVNYFIEFSANDIICMPGDML